MHTYNVAEGRIWGRGTNRDKRQNKILTFTSNAPFRSCISKLNGKFKGNAEDLKDLTIILWHEEICGIIIEMN